ncbi:hypothetical protein HDK64DRAFT_300020 [Phyllosticta capitalensis]
MAEPTISLFSWTCCFCGTANAPATTSTPSTLTTTPHALRCRLCAKAPCPTCNVSADSVGPPASPHVLYMKLAPPDLDDCVAHGYICPYCGGAAVQTTVAALLERAAHDAFAPTAAAVTRFERHGHRRWHYLEPVLPRCALCGRRVTRPGERLDFWLVREGAAREMLSGRLHAGAVRWCTGEVGPADRARVQPGVVERLKSGAGAWDTWTTVRDNGTVVHAAGVLLLVLCAAAG